MKKIIGMVLLFFVGGSLHGMKNKKEIKKEALKNLVEFREQEKKELAKKLENELNKKKSNRTLTETSSPSWRYRLESSPTWGPFICCWRLMF